MGEGYGWGSGREGGREEEREDGWRDRGLEGVEIIQVKLGKNAQTGQVNETKAYVKKIGMV